MFVSVCGLIEAGESIGSLRAEVKGGGDPPAMGAGNRTWSSERAVCVLSHWTISPALRHTL